MPNQPDSFQHLLDQYLFRMCTKYGYCLSAVERRRIVHDVKWVDEAYFVEQLMTAEGLEPAEQPKHFKEMTAELMQLISGSNKSQ